MNSFISPFCMCLVRFQVLTLADNKMVRAFSHAVVNWLMSHITLYFAYQHNGKKARNYTSNQDTDICASAENVDTPRVNLSSAGSELFQ